VARREALRGCSLPAFRRSGSRQKPPLAPHGALPPLIFSRGTAHTSDAQAPRDCESLAVWYLNLWWRAGAQSIPLRSCA